jgi:hypothetical protein
VTICTSKAGSAEPIGYSATRRERAVQSRVSVHRRGTRILENMCARPTIVQLKMLSKQGRRSGGGHDSETHQQYRRDCAER